jgi:hypothetical protein
VTALHGRPSTQKYFRREWKIYGDFLKVWFPSSQFKVINATGKIEEIKKNKNIYCSPKSYENIKNTKGISNFFSVK